jgi:hypothetical protein
LTLFDFSTHEWVGLTTTITVGYPNWSRDSRYIHFGAPGADPAFYRVRISDRKPILKEAKAEYAKLK